MQGQLYSSSNVSSAIIAEEQNVKIDHMVNLLSYNDSARCGGGVCVTVVGKS